MSYYSIKIMENIIWQQPGLHWELGAGGAGGYCVPGVHKVCPEGIFCPQMRTEGSAPPQFPVSLLRRINACHICKVTLHFDYSLHFSLIMSPFLLLKRLLKFSNIIRNNNNQLKSCGY